MSKDLSSTVLLSFSRSVIIAHPRWEIWRDPRVLLITRTSHQVCARTTLSSFILTHKSVLFEEIVPVFLFQRFVRWRLRAHRFPVCMCSAGSWCELLITLKQPHFTNLKTEQALSAQLQEQNSWVTSSKAQHPLVRSIGTYFITFGATTQANGKCLHVRLYKDAALAYRNTRAALMLPCGIDCFLCLISEGISVSCLAAVAINLSIRLDVQNSVCLQLIRFHHDPLPRSYLTGMTFTPAKQWKFLPGTAQSCEISK